MTPASACKSGPGVRVTGEARERSVAQQKIRIRLKGYDHSQLDKSAKSIEIGGRLISELKGMCQGVHVMAIGWESRIPAMLEAAGIARQA